MKNEQKSKLIRAGVFAILALLLVCFIFSNSLQSRGESSKRSSAVMHLIKPILDPHGRISDADFHHYLRKTAHFAEFAALGFLLLGFVDCFAWKSGKKRWHLLPPLLSLLVAVTDETIQIFSPLRGPGISDVILDFCGAVFGAACMAALLLLLRKKS